MTVPRFRIINADHAVPIRDASNDMVLHVDADRLGGFFQIQPFLERSESRLDRIDPADAGIDRLGNERRSPGIRLALCRRFFDGSADAF